MGLIMKLGVGYRKPTFRFGKSEYTECEDEPFGKDFIKIEKTKNEISGQKFFFDEWKFSYFNKEKELKTFLIGHPMKENREFYLFRIQDSKIKEKNMFKIYLKYRFVQIYKPIQEKFKRLTEIKNEFDGMEFKKDSIKLYAFLKDYLEKENFEKIVAQTNYRLFDLTDIALRFGWKDLKDGRELEKYKKKPEERKEHETLLEKLTKVVVLEYPLDGKKD